ncbi:hypothetical protein L3Y34_008384 [Caenorhabditis briggsae]|uniref:PLD phosphodiesterase domain-containing protein n=2 Tax=Caenorhabditis briggsae TaxID=6238 RepID=A0AAE9A2Z4_CAEBR|nr:hypothetical protein L3Y34_008384 [Caenorhabditis briggsae]
MKTRSLLLSHSLVAIVAVIITTAIWLTTYFVAVNPNINNGGNVVNNNYSNNYCPSSDSTCKLPEMPKCAETCEFVICESIPAGLQFNSSYNIFNSTTDCWMRLMKEAQQEILIGSYYWSLLVNDTGDGYTTDPTNTSYNGEQIYNTLLSTAVDRNISVRIAQTYENGGYWETENLVQKSNGRIRVRSLDFTQWYPGGILHTKSWSVDGKHFYIGSANFDWRSLTNVKELGIAVFNCPCMANDLKNLLEIYWTMGAPGATIPQQWDSRVSTPANHQTPMSVYQPTGSQAMYISASPPGFQACGREDDLVAMIKTIDEAQDYLHLAVMDYSPSTKYLKNNNKWKPELDTAIRRAAFERGVHVRFMVSLWPHTYPEAYGVLYSLQDISDHLPCYKWDSNDNCIKKGSIEIRMIQVPDMGYGKIPYARVYHNKYFVTESTAYIGTSNWSSDYWQYTAGIGIVIRADDSTAKSQLVQQITSIHERDWTSAYTIPLKNFTISGNRTTTFF